MWLLSSHHLFITENEFEFAMGFFEKITDEKCPDLHLMCRISLPIMLVLLICMLRIFWITTLSEYEPSFASTPLTHSFFASFQIPSYCCDSVHLSSRESSIGGDEKLLAKVAKSYPS